MKDNWRQFGIQATFVVCLVLIGTLCFVQGRWTGLRILCPEPNVIGTNMTNIICYDHDTWEEMNKGPMDDFNLEDYDGFKT
ncbi:MAG TPA: hypothetical protein PLG47_05075 [Candidatus Dojkabacteria bacterium]|nr:hypothetical protein [Candidatus Dojkabacteria bacterium]